MLITFLWKINCFPNLLGNKLLSFFNEGFCQELELRTVLQNVATFLDELWGSEGRHLTVSANKKTD